MRLTRWMRGSACAFAVLLAWAGSGLAARAAEKPCPVAEDSFVYEPLLPVTLAALDAGRKLTIVAIGGASTDGTAAGGPEASWPVRFVEALRVRFPAARIDLVVHAVPRQTSAEMAARFARDVRPLRPTLVIWEAGTTDAVRGTDIDEFRTTLENGIAELRSMAAEVVLMDMQYSRLTHSVIYFNRYLVVLRGVADVSDVPLFPRHKIMYDWSEMGLLEQSDRSPGARRALADKLYRCIGQAVAEFVLRRPAAAVDQR